MSRPTPYRYIPLLNDVYRSARRAIYAVAYSGNTVECACCDKQFSKWLNTTSICPYCRSSARQRILCSHLDKHHTPSNGSLEVLLFAPDFATERYLKRHPHFQVTTADLSAPYVDYHWDITQLPCADGSFDLILVSHVLEHVPDDAKAISEMHRCLTKGGTALVQVPFAKDAEETFEDSSITDPKRRKELFGQFDHVRIYGQDISDRLKHAGFNVSLLFASSEFSDEEMKKYGLWDDILFVCQKNA